MKFQKTLKKQRRVNYHEPGTSEVEDVRQAFVQLWGTMSPFWGVAPMTARVYSWLLTRAQPADAEQIMAGLELSRGAVSMACKELREWRLVEVEKEPGSRRVRYAPMTDLEKVIRNVIAVRKRHEWDPIREHLREWIPRLEAETSPEAQAFRERLEAIELFLDRADELVDLFLRGGMVGRVGLRFLVRGGGGAEVAANGGTGEGERKKDR